MPTVLDEFVAILSPKSLGRLRGTAKIVVEGVGAVLLDETGAKIGDGVADVSLIASEDTFRNLFSGAQTPLMAVMMRKLKVEGNPQRALKLGDILLG